MFELENYRVEYDADSCTLIIHLPPNQTEFASELGIIDRTKRRNLQQFIQEVINKRAKNLHVKSVKIMLGATLISSLALNSNQAEA